MLLTMTEYVLTGEFHVHRHVACCSMDYRFDCSNEERAMVRSWRHDNERPKVREKKSVEVD